MSSVILSRNVERSNGKTVVSMLARLDGKEIAFQFDLGAFPAPNILALDEATVIAGIGLAMGHGVPLRVDGSISRSLFANLEAYQAACCWWWPQRFSRVPIEVGTVDDRLPATTRGIATFSGGVDTVYSAIVLSEARTIDSLCLIRGFDLDGSNTGALREQAIFTQKLAQSIGLSITGIATNMRESIGEAALEGVQGTVLCAALTLLSDRYGSAFVSCEHMNLDSCWQPGPMHPQLITALGSFRFPISVHGSQAARMEKIQCLAGRGDMLDHVRICIDRSSTSKHCGACRKCVLNAFAFYAARGVWPDWTPRGGPDASVLERLQPQRYSHEFMRDIARAALSNGHGGTWLDVMAAKIGEPLQSLAQRTPVAEKMEKPHRRVRYLLGSSGGPVRRRLKRIAREIMGRDIA